MHLACQPLLKRLTGDKRSHKVLEALLDLNTEALPALDMLKVRLCASTCVYDGLIEEKKKNRWNIATRKIYNEKEKVMRLSACLSVRAYAHRDEGTVRHSGLFSCTLKDVQVDVGYF